MRSAIKQLPRPGLAASLIALLSVAACGGGSSNSSTPPPSGDVERPSVSSTSPAVNVVDTPINSNISVTFSEDMDASTFTPATLSIEGVNAATFVYDSQSRIATYAMRSLFVNSTTYRATLHAVVADLAGNTPASDFVWTFTTAAVPDLTPPTVLSTLPADLAVGFPTNGKPTARFSESMQSLTINPSSFTLQQGLTTVSGTVSYADAAKVATFAPTVTLTASTVYTGTITTEVKDLAGNNLALNRTWTFTTAAVADTTPPAVNTVSPINAETGVGVNKKVNAAFSESIDPTTITTSTFKLTGPGLTPVTGTVDYVDVLLSQSNATFDPSNDLPSNTTITGRLTTGVRDLAGNSLTADFVWTFKTGVTSDTTAPTVTATVPTNTATNVAVNSNMSAVFSEAMDPATINTATFTVARGATVTGQVTYELVGRTATFRPGSPQPVDLDANTTYTATVTTGAKDLAGNPKAQNFVWTFTTGAARDTTPPAVTTTSPIPNALGVNIDKTISATFTEPMDPATISTASFTLTGPGGSAVSGTAAYDVPGRIASFNPTANLAPSTLFTATITAVVADLAGNTLTSNFVWSFTTGTQLTPGPINLGTVAPFAGCGGFAGMTNDGLLTVMNGDILTTAPSTLITGFHDGPTAADSYTETPLNKGLVNGTIFADAPLPGTAGKAAIAQIALDDARAAFTALSAGNLPGGIDLGGDELGGRTLFPGVYTSAPGTYRIEISDLTLDGQGDANAVWVFQMASSLSVGLPGPTGARTVHLINGAQAKNVYWQVGSRATINAAGGGTMVGTIIAQTGAAFSTVGNVNLVTLDGRALGLDASVTVTNTIINVPAP